MSESMEEAAYNAAEYEAEMQHEAELNAAGEAEAQAANE